MGNAHTEVRRRTGRQTPAPRWPARTIRFVEHKGKRGGYHFRYESHAGHELIYVDYGRLRLQLADGVRTLGPGECFVMPARRRHSIRSDGERAFSFLNVLYEGSCPRRISGRVLHLPCEQQRAMRGLRDEAAAGLRHGRELVLLRFNVLLLELDRGATVAPGLDAAGGAEAANESHFRSTVVMRALEYLESHAAQPLDSDALARAAGVSPPHLRRLVRRHTGSPLARHLQELRMAAARRMLMDSAASVTEIARRVGYESPPHFCTVFKRLVGMTPGQYARSLGQPGSPSKTANA